MLFVQSGKITRVLSAFAKIKGFIALYTCLAGIVILQSQEYKKSTQSINSANYLIQEEEQARLINWQQQSPKLGFRNLMADWSYLNFVQYFGDKTARETIGYELIPDYFKTISTIDPHFTQAHLRLSIANSMYAGHPEQTIALMDRVLNSVNPESDQAALLWTSKGLDELLFLGDKEAAIKSYKMAAKWADLQSKNFDNYLLRDNWQFYRANSDRQANRQYSLTIKDLEKALESTSEIDLKMAQIRAWSSVLVHIKDNQRKREIVNKITDLKSEIMILNQENQKSAVITH